MSYGSKANGSCTECHGGLGLATNWFHGLPFCSLACRLTWARVDELIKDERKRAIEEALGC